MNRLILLFLGAAILCCGTGDAFAGAKKKKTKVAIRFYPQAGNEGGDFSSPVTLIHNGQSSSMSQMPLITEDEIVACQAVKVADGSYGVCFKLDQHGTNLLSQHTLSKRDTYLFGFVNGRHVIDLYIDRGVRNGEICFPRGLTANEVALIEQSFGEDKKGSSKKSKSTPTPQ